MKQKINVTIEEAGISFGTGTIANLAGGSVTVTLGETNILVTATAAASLREGQDFFPLTVDYREKYAAAGRFPGGYFKREGRPTEKEILTSRLCDRPCRPLFPKGFLNEVQIIGILLSTDQQNEPDILMVNGASAALAISDIPWNGPIAAVRVARIDGQFIANPTLDQQFDSDLDLIYVGTENEMLMIEGSADQIPEDDFLEALDYAHAAIQPILAGIRELVAKAGKPKKEFTLALPDPKVVEIASEVMKGRLGEAVRLGIKQDRQAAIQALRQEAEEKIAAAIGADSFNPTHLSMAMEDLQEAAYREPVLREKIRSGGRGPAELREISCEVGVLPRVHGSALFARGETQALVLATLGPTKESQDLDALTGGPKSKSFILHYNFPPFSVGEAGRFGFTNRREIGHGALAERSLLPIIPPEDQFPYSIRLTSEIMSSNGSTSMASVCGGCLALMDAGVPVTAIVAGISVGLISSRTSQGAIDQSVLLTDILGEEDHFGDMDFKICGTRKGITGFQLDLKIAGLPRDLTHRAVAQARTARLEILDMMEASLPSPRSELSKHAPRIETIMIDPDKIGALIGPGGKTIRRITEITGTQIDIDNDNSGRVLVYSTNAEALERAVREIDLVCGTIEEGKIYRGVVKSVKEFGCFVEVLPGQEGLVHISELADFRVRRTEDVCKEGDEMVVKCLGTDDRGRIRLSRKAALAELEERKAKAATEEACSPEDDSGTESDTEMESEPETSVDEVGSNDDSSSEEPKTEKPGL